MPKPKTTKTDRQPLDLRRATDVLVIDHHTVHHGLGTASIHVLEQDADGNTKGGQDIDGVTREELGMGEKEDVVTALTSERMVSFVKKLSGGVKVSMDKPKKVEVQDADEE